MTESIDLLIDGELTSGESGRLLQRLEVEENGWRHCALAYIEDQQWASAIQQHAEEAGQEQREALSNGTCDILQAPSDKQLGRSRFRAAGWWMALTTAAVWAFVAGRWSVPGDTGTPAGITTEQFAGSDDTAAEDTKLVIADDAELQSVTNSPQYVGSTDFELPLIDVSESGAVWYDQPQTVPREVQRAIQRLGGRIDQEYFFAPAEMEDGRHLVVPIERVRIHPVGTRQVY